MNENLLSNGLLGAALAVFLVARQFMPRPVRPRIMAAVPLVAGYLGLRALLGAPPDGVLAVAALSLNLALGAVLGLVRGSTVRVWQNAGTWMMQGTVLTFVFWLVSIGLRVLLGLADHTAFSQTDLSLFVAVTFGAQNLVVWTRVAGVAPAALRVRPR